LIAALLDPKKYLIGEPDIFWVFFQLIDEDAGVECDALVTTKKRAERI